MDTPHAAADPLAKAGPRIGLWRLTMLLFFAVSGGAYGLEDVVGSAGPGMALVLILVTPLVWSLPEALVVAELAAAIPEEGGYYVWVRRAAGPFWGFQEGWWSWLQSLVDMAIYPVLFAEYLSTLLRQQAGVTLLDDNPVVRWAVTLAFIWGLVGLNLRGVRPVGSAAIVLAVIVLAPFAVMSIVGIVRWCGDPAPFWLPWTPADKTLPQAFTAGLFMAMWNYFGWDAASTYAGEIDRPQRTYPLAMAVALPLIVLAYLLPTAAGLTLHGDWTAWKAGYFPELGAQLAGPWLGVALAAGGMFYALGMFNSLLLSYSRVPLAMAADGYFPRALAQVNSRTGAPTAAILLCGVAYSFCTLGGFQTLVVLDVLLYASALVLEFVALVALRIREPHLPRPYKIPGGWPMIAIVCLSPALVLGLAVVSTIQDEGAHSLALPAAALVSGPIAYWLLRRRADAAPVADA